MILIGFIYQLSSFIRREEATANHYHINHKIPALQKKKKYLIQTHLKSEHHQKTKRIKNHYLSLSLHFQFFINYMQLKYFLARKKFREALKPYDVKGKRI